MKKVSFLVLAFVASLFVMSCSSDDSNSPQPPQPEKDTAIVAKYEYDVSQDLLDLFEVKVVYTDKDGVTKDKVITDLKGEFNFETTKNPFKYSFKREIKYKEGIELTKDKYLLRLYRSYSVTGNKSHQGEGGGPSGVRPTVTKAQLESPEFRERIINGLQSTDSGEVAFR